MRYYPWSTNKINNNQKENENTIILRRCSLLTVVGLWVKFKYSYQINKIITVKVATTVVWFFWYLVWVFGRSDYAKHQIVFPYRIWLKNLIKVLWQIATMK